MTNRRDAVTLRSFEPADADAVAALIRATLLTSNIVDYPLAELLPLADWYSASGLVSRMPYARRLVAEASGGIVGTAARRDHHLEGFFVAPDQQGRGIGAQLLAALLDDARSDALRFVVLDSSLTAVGFYGAQGFVATGPAVDSGDGVVVPMRLSLD